MRTYSPGASVEDEFAYFCDVCEKKESKRLLVWRKLPDREGHFALCLGCLSGLYFEYVKDNESRDL